MAITINGTSGISGVDGTAGTPALQGTDSNTGISFGADQVNINTGGSTRATVDSSGRVGIGTTSVGANLHVAGSSERVVKIQHTGNTNGLDIGNNTTESFISTVDNKPITVYTNGLERAKIDASGRLLVGTSTAVDLTSNVEGVALNSNSAGAFVLGCIGASASGQTPINVNRKTNDGRLIQFHQDGTEEGSIQVSGTTISYNGAHLSRWSQLPGGGRTEILRGTVLSNIDEMCDWGEEENEQLNRMKVSDVEGDPNVSGVFQAWDDDDDTYTDDFYCAMTGDFIIRIAEGVTVQRGDLLMSAGDGTAKPQDDDIIRSKTIAKVTSTHITCTYDDGSYCVPCVLMAC
jgi:hypothetical protein